MGFARIRRSIPQLLGAALFSVAAVGALAGCSGKDKKDPKAVGSIDPNTAVLLEEFGFTFGFSARATATGDAFVVVSNTGDVTAIVDLTNNIVDIYDTSGSVANPALIASVNLNTVKMFSTDAAAALAHWDEDGTDSDARDVYDNPEGGDTFAIGGAAIHPSDEYLVVAVNDANDNGLFDDNPFDPIASITRSPSRLVFISLASVAADSTGQVALPSRSAGSLLGVTRLSEFDNEEFDGEDAGASGDGNDVSGDNADGHANVFNVTGVAISPNGRNMAVVGNYPDEIDLSGDGAHDATDGPDGSFDDDFDILDNNDTLGHLVGQSTIAFFGADNLGNASVEGALPTSASDLRDINFDGPLSNDFTLENFGMNLHDDPTDDGDGEADGHTFPFAVSSGDARVFIAVLGSRGGDAGTGGNQIAVLQEDARDNARAAGDADLAITGLPTTASLAEGLDISLLDASGCDAVLVPSPSLFVGGFQVIDGSVFPAVAAGDAKPTDTLYTFVGFVREHDTELVNPTFGAVFVTGFGLRGDVQARVSPAATGFGASRFVGNNASQIQAVATVPALDSAVVFPINTVANADNFLYGELFDGSSFDLNTFVTTPNLTLEGLDGFTRVGRNFFVVTNSTAGASDNTAIGVYQITAPIQTITSGAGSFRVVNPVTVDVDAVTFANSGNRSGSTVGAASVATGDSRDFFAVYNRTERNWTLIRY